MIPGQIGRRQLIGAGAAFALLAGARGSVGASATALSIKVYKDPSCGCCTAWVERLKDAGFAAQVEERADMSALKVSLGVPDDLASCHTGVAGGYTIEGHVPPGDIQKLLAAQATAKGLAVAGMPINSPGMEMPGAANEPYTVWLFQADGKRTAFARHD
jgi:hypothetical protein